MNDYCDEPTQECKEGLLCFVEAARSFSDEFGNAISSDISLITGSYMIILAYTIFNLSGRPLLKSRILLSLGAILVSSILVRCSIMVVPFTFEYMPFRRFVVLVAAGIRAQQAFFERLLLLF